MKPKDKLKKINAGNKIIQQTRKWDDNKGKSYAMRSKENSNDYRYFPDPDLLTVAIYKQNIEEIRKTIPELAKDRIKKYTEEI